MEGYVLFVGFEAENAIFRDKDDNFSLIPKGNLVDAEALKTFRYYAQGTDAKGKVECKPYQQSA